MAYGDSVGKGYAAGTATDALAGRDLGRTGTPVPIVQEVTHEVTGIATLAPVKVTTAGTRVALSGSALLCVRAMVQALETNSGVVVVGDVNCVAAAGTQTSPTRRGFRLAPPGDWLEFNFRDLSAVYIDAVTSGDGVSVTYWI